MHYSWLIVRSVKYLCINVPILIDVDLPHVLTSNTINIVSDA